MDKHTVFGTDGTADLAASTNAYAKALAEWKKANEIPVDRIEAAVEAVFDRFPSQRLAMPMLLNLAVAELGGAPTQFKTLQDAVHGYVTGQSAKNTGRIDIVKGKNGGVQRLALPGQPVPARPAKSA